MVQAILNAMHFVYKMLAFFINTGNAFS